MNHSSPDASTITAEITIKASVDRVFLALTHPEERVKWWGTEGRFKATYMESDLRPGGKWLMRGIGVGGRPFTIQGTYREIKRPSLLAFTWFPSWQDDNLETLVRFDLEEKEEYRRPSDGDRPAEREAQRNGKRGSIWPLATGSSTSTT